ncbi:MAG: hypothetical protein ACO4AV_13410 [bacterium]
MSRKVKTKLHFKYSETGALLFTAEQTRRRFALCREALTGNKKYSLRVKRIYSSQKEVEDYCIKDFTSEDIFTANYMKLYQRAWGGEYFDYRGFCSAEGAFFPFVRTRFNSHQPIDEGCIWIGNISSYPLIYVANNIAKWACPYSQGGFVRVEPFLPYAEVRKILPRLMDKRMYPDLCFDYF